MTRPRREDHGHFPLHVVARGVEEGILFPDDQSRRLFWNEFGAWALELNVVIGHVCLMSTHYHLMVRSTPDALAEALMHTHRKLAWYVNRNGRRGRAFGRRYQVFPIDDAKHLRLASRYIPLNPVKARMVRDPADWRWSTHRFLIGRDTPPAWYDIKAALRMVAFFDSRSYARWTLSDSPLAPPPMTKRELVDHRICVMAEFGIAEGEIAENLGLGTRRVRETIAHAALRSTRASQGPNLRALNESGPGSKSA